MAILFDAVTTSPGTSSWSFNHTCTGSNRLLIVSITQDINSGSGQVTGVTYGGVAMTQVTNSPVVNSSGGTRVYMFYLINPASGVNSVAITVGASAPFAIAAAKSYKGVAQTNAVGAGAKATGNSDTPTVNVTPPASGSMVVDAVGHFGGSTETAGANQTQRANASNSTAHLACSEEPGAATVTMSWGLGTTRQWAIIAIPIVPYSAPGFFAFF